MLNYQRVGLVRIFGTTLEIFMIWWMRHESTSTSTEADLWKTPHRETDPGNWPMSGDEERATWGLVFFLGKTVVSPWPSPDVDMGVSGKMLCTPLYPMVLLIIIPMKNGYFIGNINPTFSDKPTWPFRWGIAEAFVTYVTGGPLWHEGQQSGETPSSIRNVHSWHAVLGSVGWTDSERHPQVSLMTSCCSGSELFTVPQLYGFVWK